ncbi:MAG: methyltransferase domain-containing protein [Deltaproteobacteria bacterium]|nr:methyltransferase domain-containing protein [Deltaproteobacteria bacterium]
MADPKPEGAKGFSWSTFYGYRKEIRKFYPSVYGLRIRKKLFDVVMEEVLSGDRVLDVGASTRSLGERIQARAPAVTYKTMDIDRAGSHDYYSLDDIKERFNLIILSEVIEHLEFNDGIGLLRRLNGLLAPGGKIIISTPNMHHPNRWWDSDHRTSYRYDEIAGALVWTGYEIKGIYRIYNDQFARRFVRLHLMAWLHRYLDVDFATSVVVVAVKK